MLRTTNTWSNMQPVLDAYRAVLPVELRSWAELTRGQQDMIDELRAMVGVLAAERQALSAALERRDRYLEILRRLTGRGRRE